MPFTYTLSIPAAENNPSVDQPDMQTNTNSINSLINVDHYTFNATDAGAHQKVNFPLALSPVPAVTGDAGLLYTELDGGGASQLYFKNKDTTKQMTGPSTVAGNGYVTLPGGIIMQWGTVTSAATTVPVTLPLSYSSIATFYNIQVTSQNVPTALFSAGPPTAANTFNIIRSGLPVTVTYYWTTIGS